MYIKEKNVYPKTIFIRIEKEAGTIFIISDNQCSLKMSSILTVFSQQIDQDLTIYWHSCMQYVVVVTVDLMKTSQVIQTGPSPSDVIQYQVMGRALLKRCCDILAGTFHMQKLPWIVQPCTWSQQQEEKIKTR